MINQSRSFYRSFTFMSAILLLVLVLTASSALSVSAKGTPVRVIVDVDMGVDDATAVAWLLDQERYPVEVVGITTVAGNTAVDNAANNVLNVLQVAERTDIPVVIGAGAPLAQPVSRTGALVHGPDGLWFVGAQNPQDISGLSHDVTGFYCEQAGADVTIIALGPLTNLALALEECPATLQSVRQIVVLGGAQVGGNRVPDAEFNIWFDPEAAHQVLTAGLPLTLVTLDAFDTFQIDQEDLEELQEEGTPLGQFVATPLQFYAQAQAGLGTFESTSIPDVVAVVYALDNQLGDAQSGLVKVTHGIFDDDVNRQVRGHTTIGVTFEDKIAMIATDAELSAIADRAFTDPDFDLATELFPILMREPDNALVVLDINHKKVRRLFMKGLTD